MDFEPLKSLKKERFKELLVELTFCKKNVFGMFAFAIAQQFIFAGRLFFTSLCRSVESNWIYKGRNLPLCPKVDQKSEDELLGPRGPESLNGVEKESVKIVEHSSEPIFGKGMRRSTSQWKKGSSVKRGEAIQ